VASRLGVAAVVGLAAALAASAALADGDPASDVLVGSNVYFPSPPPTPAAQARLAQSVQAVVAKGDRVKVAVIATRSDLGAIPSLFGKPQAYAKFLGLELRFVYSGALLIAMPQGFGFYNGGRATTKATETLHGIPIASGTPDGLSRAAAAAVDRLATTGVLRFVDTQPPQVYVVQTSGRRGRTVPLRYWGLDNSGRARITASVARGGTVLARFATGLKTLTPALVYKFDWTIPPGTKPGRVAYCARATDPAGNRSPKACTEIRVT
jgi:hypothetical protein